MFCAPNRGGSLSLIKWLVIFLLNYWLIGLASVNADDTADRRIQISLPVFPRIVAVDKEFKQKLSSGKKVLFVFLYEFDKDKAESLAKSLQNKLTNVAGMRFSTATVLAADQMLATAPVPTALFAVEPFSEKTFAAAVKYSIQHQRILFSPFAGDVERGAMAGIAIGSRVRPYFNMNSLKRGGININAVLLNLSKRYE
jgi:hypothetical protein